MGETCQVENDKKIDAGWAAVIAAIGGGSRAQSKLARILGVKRQVVNQWKHNRIPVGWIVRIEKATGVPRQKLRPELYEDLPFSFTADR
jgi:DNA-binding transcriptional regulator YdaS (Cro superfamily)